MFNLFIRIEMKMKSARGFIWLTLLFMTEKKASKIMKSGSEKRRERESNSKRNGIIHTEKKCNVNIVKNIYIRRRLVASNNELILITLAVCRACHVCCVYVFTATVFFICHSAFFITNYEVHGRAFRVFSVNNLMG